MRGIQSGRMLSRVIFKNRAKGALFSIACGSAFILIFGAVLVLEFERGGNTNISEPGDALWWACLLMVSGVGLFSTFTGYIASLVDEDAEEEDVRRDEAVLAEVKALREEMAELRRFLRGKG